MWLVEEWGVDRFREMIEQQMGDKLAKGVRRYLVSRSSVQHVSQHRGTADWACANFAGPTSRLIPLAAELEM